MCERDKQDILLNISEQSPMYKILTRPVSIEKPNFSAEALPANQKQKLRKYFTPTEPNWGPKPRATGGDKGQKQKD